MRLRVLLLIAASAVATCVLEAPVASASCVPPRPAPLLRDADAAFVGRLVETQPDRWIFAVDERVKGDLGATVAVARGGITSVSLTPEPGRRVGLLLQGSAETGLDVEQLPAALAGAAARRGCRPGRPVPAAPDPVGPIPAARPCRRRARRPRRPVDERHGALGRRDGEHGARRAGALRRTVVVRHAYRRPGRHRVRVSVAARPALACGSFVEGVVAAPIVAHT